MDKGKRFVVICILIPLTMGTRGFKANRRANRRAGKSPLVFDYLISAVRRKETGEEGKSRGSSWPSLA